MLKRMFFGVGAGMIVTALLFLLMQKLITSDRRPFEEVAIVNIVDFVPVVEELEVRTTRKRPDPPPEPDEMPPDLPDVPVDPTKGAAGTEITPPIVDKPQVAGTISYADGDQIPVATVSPNYPSRAIARGIEGFVLLEFTVTRAGQVRDPVVVESEPSGIFERAALNAVRKFKYKPRIVNGTPVDVSGVLNRITFSLQDG